MAMQQVLDALDLLDGWVTGADVASELRNQGLDVATTDVVEGSARAFVSALNKALVRRSSALADEERDG